MSTLPAAFTRLDNDLLDIQAELHTIDTALTAMYAGRVVLSRTGSREAAHLATRDVEALHEPLVRLRGVRERVGAATAAWRAGFFPERSR